MTNSISGVAGIRLNTSAQNQSVDQAQSDDATPSPEPQRCHLAVRFNPLGPGYYHSYIVTSDSSGVDYLRGGPGRPPAERPDVGILGHVSSALGGAVSQSSGSDNFTSSNSGNSASAGSGPGGQDASSGLYGNIDVDSGSYDKHAVDWRNEPVPTVVVDEIPENCDKIEAEMNNIAQEIVGQDIPYNPFTSNSNSLAREVLDRAGYPNTKPPVWAPGWSKLLAP